MEQKQKKKYIKPIIVSRGKVAEVTLQVSSSEPVSGSFFSSPTGGPGF